MKTFLKLAAIAVTLVFTSCDKKEDTPETLDGKNLVSITFETAFNEQALNIADLGTKEFTHKDDKLKISAFDFIAGNFILIDDKGKEFVYPKEKSFFIISMGGKKKDKKTKEIKTVAKQLTIELKDVPAGKYKAIKFGVGVDENTYKEGNQFANSLWERAEGYSLTWSWASGYKFLVLEGMVGEKPFKYHVAAAANVDKYKAGKELYREFNINIENGFLVANDKAPQIHLLADAGKILKSVKVSETPVLMGPKTKTISEDSKDMFTYEHTHYNEANH